MKHIIWLFCCIILSDSLIAQAIISTDGSAPHSSAMLQVKSTSKGFLLPFMSTTQRTAISTPADGLMVYDTDTKLVYHWDGTGWRHMVNSTFWNTSTSRNAVYNLSDSIGIGTATPLEKLHLSNGQIRLSRTASSSNYIISNMPSAQLVGEHEGLKFQLDNVDKAFIGYTSTSTSGNFIRLSGNGVNSNDLVVDASGRTGLGTPTPTEKLHVAGNVLLNNTNPILQLQNAGTDKGFVQLSGDDLRLGTNSGNSLGRLVLRLNGGDRIFIEPDGKMGIGQDGADAKLHINSGASFETVRLTGNTNTIIRFMTGTTEKANIYSASNHLSLTTAQPGGQVRLNNEVYVDADLSRVGIGTSTPDERLHVSGNIKTTTGRVTNNSNENMLPIAYAYFNGDGSKYSGTANISASQVTGSGSSKYYVVTVSGVDLSNAVAVGNPGFNPTGGYSIGIEHHSSDATKLRVQIINAGSGSSVHSDFHLVVYKP